MKKRMISLVMAIVMLMSITNLSACGREELAETHGIVTTDKPENDSHDHSTNPLKAEASDVKSDELDAEVEAMATEVENLRVQLAAAEVDNADLTASNEELAKALEEAKKTAEANVAEAQAEVTKLQKENDSLLKKIASYNELEAANKKLQKAYDELVSLQESGYFVLDGIAYCRYEYAVKRTLNQLADGTWYHQANSKVTDVVLYDDIIIGGNTMVYLDKTVEMARRDWNIAVSFDGGKSIYSASIGNYKWSENAAFQGGVLKTGYNLVETDKNGKFGRQDTIAQVIIGVVVNEKAELGVDFYVKAGLYADNPVVKPACNHGKDCHCGNCDKCPALAPEKVVEVVTKTEVKTEYVKTEVPGETVYVEVPGETVYVEVPGETVYVEVPGETQYVEVPGETVYVEVPGETKYIEVPGETVTVKVCMICGKSDCQGHVDTETVTVKVCMICGKSDCQGHVETEKVYYCGKCGNLLEDCTCSDSDHNDLEDEKDPNDPVEPGHNDLEEVEDPNKQPSNSDHSNLGSTSNSGSDGNKNSGHNTSSSNKKSGHSALD